MLETEKRCGKTLHQNRKDKFMKLDIKTLITLLTIAAVLGGFYYTTQIRLDSLEQEVTQVKKQIKRLTRLTKK